MSPQRGCLDKKDDIINRLNRIEGQIKGIQRMVEQDKQCVDILTQVSAVRSAINKVGGIILERYSKSCLLSPMSQEEKEIKLEELNRTVQKFLNFVD